MINSSVVLITGAAGALGSAAARKLAADGFKVMLLDLPKSQGPAIAEEIGKNAAYVEANIKDENEVKQALSETKSKFGKINVILNCAAVYSSKVIFNAHKNSTIQMDYIKPPIETNLIGTLNVIRLGVPYMFENSLDENGQRGLIINTAGSPAHDGQIGQVILSACMGSIVSMTLPLCRDLAPSGIRVMTISPGLFDSELLDAIPKKITRYLTTITPSPKRLGKPSEFAHLVKSIIENPFLNGEVIRLDGGLKMNLI